ncbi:hypothetical protein BJV78DRAFT_526688 [Lactifluus subvellereus]|nr:hypothetical protein BJV78DRAFT_526688 [Lactifluus subvellereus]
MMTTHVDARALEQFQGNGGDTEGSPISRINKLPGEVLLEIFDSYRKGFKYIKQWNRIDGWFKLSHVCRKWREAVLASSSRLDLRLFLTVSHHINAALMRRLPPLPIVLNYEMGVRTARDHDRIVAALKYCDRVREIAFRGSGSGLDKFLKATKRSFPVLESLELCHSSSGFDLKLPHKFLGGSAPFIIICNGAR